MSAQAVGRYMPAVVTLDDLAAIIAADEHGLRYETSTEGALSIVPPPDSEHAEIATQLMAWFITAGVPLRQIMQVPGIRIQGPAVVGGRIPDLVVWSRPQEPAVWLPPHDLLLVIEIVSRGSEGTDQVTKVAEYASAGIPRYWMVARDTANTVTFFQLGVNGQYEMSAKVPLAWLLRTSPHDHLPEVV